MNKKGFTLIELLAVIIIFGIISTIAVTSYSSYIDKSSSEAYHNQEDTMIGAAKSLLTFCMTDTLTNGDCEAIPSVTQYIDIGLEKLVNNNFMSLVKDQKKGGTCTGKVRVYNKKSDSDNYNLEYTVCLKCSDYQSSSCWY